jgi:hypothetical protein
MGVSLTSCRSAARASSVRRSAASLSGEHEQCCTRTASALPSPLGTYTAVKKSRVVTVGIRWEIAHGPFRDARRLPSTRWYPVPGATRTTLGFGICPSFKDHFLSRRA